MAFSVKKNVLSCWPVGLKMALYRSDTIQDKSTEVPRACIFRYDRFPHLIGDLSDVYRCTMVSKSHGKIEVAIKSLRILDSSEEAIRVLRKRIYGEVRVWTTLHHKNVLRLFGTTSGFGSLPAFVTPWMERGSLTNYLSIEFSNLMDGDKFILLEQITTAIQYLHDRNVIHGNLSGHNILIDSKGNAHVTDFGLSAILAECDSSSCETYYPGSIRWAAPELIDLTDEEAGKPTTRSDVYSLGCVILQLPYDWLADPFHIMAARHKGMQPMAADSSVDRRHVPLLQECWSRSSDRPTVDHILSYVQSALPP
ncbi:kinase-like domain-containing protein [Suillus fuscotomentosus]|uniref:Kinase-like domain-containing protein n=1 Tax=Suillus fuscotomentosus TaxID=1912939 RepID=A0AAD4HL14_9AGAM|nr:kinase-like domain-containing protein [Suillus fuscotomentosus]KAG1900071.1 kinase-like domain-containing protein [Suillus fuscotomentosus]